MPRKRVVRKPVIQRDWQLYVRTKSCVPENASRPDLLIHWDVGYNFQGYQSTVCRDYIVEHINGKSGGMRLHKREEVYENNDLGRTGGP